MEERQRELLLGYALGALDPDEHAAVELQLADDPELRQALEGVYQSLEPLVEAYDELDPPRGLCERTCAYVADEAERLEASHPGRLTLPRADASLDLKSRWTLADWVVLSGVSVVAVLLFFPAVLNSRMMSRVTACQNNLREIGTSLVQYSEYLGTGSFPEVPLEGNQAYAGIYATRLKEADLLTQDDLVLCPDAARTASLASFGVPTLREIESAAGPELMVLQRRGGGSYAYNLGYIADGRHQPVRNQSRATFAILADAPPSGLTPAVHRQGHNILYEDQHIAFVSSQPQVQFADDPFFNDYQRCEAGIGQNDSVVAPSDSPPLRHPTAFPLK